MMTFITASALILLQAGVANTVSATSTAPSAIETTDVAYNAVATGQADDAIVEINQLLAQNPDDPALLINLGAAYLQRGEYDRAAQAYRQAVAADDRYDLELADGSWVDSRVVARQALAAVERRVLAIR